MESEKIYFNMSFGFKDYFLIGLRSAYLNPITLTIFVILPLVSITAYLFFKIAGNLDMPTRELFVALVIIFFLEICPPIKAFSDAITSWARNRKAEISTFEISVHSVIYKNPGIENKIDWGNIKKITENKRYYFVKMTNILFVWPKKQISKGSDLRAIIKNCIGNKAKLKKKYDENA